jgi:hypothetical protein
MMKSLEHFNADQGINMSYFPRILHRYTHQCRKICSSIPWALGAVLSLLLPVEQLQAQDVLYEYIRPYRYNFLAERMAVLDVNRDGINDLIVTANYNFGGGMREWRTEIHFGMPPPDIMDDTNILVLRGSDELWNTGGGATYIGRGPGLAVGDFTGDGLTDLVVQIGPREVALYPGCSDCPYAIDTARAWVLKDTTEGGYVDPSFGVVMEMGDLNGDSIDDLVVVAPGEFFKWADEMWISRMYIYFGGRAEKPHEADMLAVWRRKDGDTTYEFASDGIAIADVNGDGNKDLIVGSRQNFRSPSVRYVDLYFGGPGSRVNPQQPDQRLSFENRGSGATRVFDVNNDGYADLFTRNMLEETWEWYFGGPAGFHIRPDRSIKPTYRMYTQWLFPIEVGCNIGDVNADGWDDYLLGAPTASEAHRMLVYLGDSNGIGPWPRMVLNPPMGFGGEMMGLGAVNMGDMNGDGAADMAISSLNGSRDHPSFAIYAGNVNWVMDRAEQPSPHSLEVSSYPNPMQEYATITISGLKGNTATLVMYDALGREIRTLPVTHSGDHANIYWDACDAHGVPVPPGVYHILVRTTTTRHHSTIVK